jgi:hypothetical protein
MIIEAGKYYRTRHGDVVGPMRRTKDQFWYSCFHSWNEDGGMYLSGAEHGLDLIAEVYVSDTPPSDDMMLNLSEIARAKTKAMGEGNFGLDENPPGGVRLRWLVEVVDNPSDTPPADAPAPETKTLLDEFAMSALIGQLANQPDKPDNVAFWAYEYANAMMEARKK